MENVERSTILGFAVGLGCGLCISYVLKGRFSPRLPKSQSFGESSSGAIASDTGGEHKLILVVRNDLKMGKGKAAAQCSHATVMAYKRVKKNHPEMLKEWEYNGQPKVVTKTEDEPSLLALAEHARALGLTISIVQDAGRTQIAPGSKTVLAVGPGPVDLVNKVTGHLKLF